MDITIERTFQGLALSTIHNGYFIRRVYIGYTRKEALQIFKAYLKGVK